MARVSLFSTFIASTVFLSTQTISVAAHAEPSQEESLGAAQSLSSAFEKVANTITPSVVSISSVKHAKKITNLKKRLDDPALAPFRDFLGDDFLDKFQNPDNGAQQGLGTGVIVDASGYIMTNNHVIGEADDITVTLSDKRKFKAEIKGRDPKSDIAIVKIKADGLIPAKLGDSDALKIGEWVIASGNPFGLNNSITAGIVSAKGRSISSGTQFEDFIQTDAAINPGNSGGPLLNLKGEVIGINTAIFSRSGGYMGIGFAIPMGMARSVMESLISKGKVVRGWLGVVIQNLTEKMAKSFHYASTDGALVGSIALGSPAAKAGFEQGDIITKFKGTPITDTNQLRNLVAGTKPGEAADVEVFRSGAAKTLTVKVEELSGDEEKQADSDKPDSSLDLGLEMQSLTPELAQQLKTKKTVGVVVVDIAPGGIAESSGLQKGDLIVSVNGKSVKNVKEFLGLIDEKSLEQGIRLVVDSKGTERFVFLESE